MNYSIINVERTTVGMNGIAVLHRLHSRASTTYLVLVRKNKINIFSSFFSKQSLKNVHARDGQ